MSIAFGPAGNSDSFKASGYRSSADAPFYVASMGLNAYEYQCGNGVTVKEAGARSIGEKAREHGVRLSIHAPYYISMSGEDNEKRFGSLRYFLQSAEAARFMGATRIVYHPGGLGKQSREVALARSIETLKYVLSELDKAGYDDIVLCPEVMGKINQVGTLEEVMEMCRVDDRLIPCVDFGHLNARTLGSLKEEADFERIFDYMENTIGRERTNKFHSHFSKIQYSKGGEVRHLTLEDTEFGPDFSLLAKVLAKRGYEPTIICESAGTQAEDAKEMMECYKDALSKRQ